MENWETITRKWRQNAKKTLFPNFVTVGNSGSLIGKQVKNWETGLLMNRRKFDVLFWSAFRQDVTSNRIIYNFIFNIKKSPYLRTRIFYGSISVEKFYQIHYQINSEYQCADYSYAFPQRR